MISTDYILKLLEEKINAISSDLGNPPSWKIDGPAIMAELRAFYATKKIDTLQDLTKIYLEFFATIDLRALSHLDSAKLNTIISRELGTLVEDGVENQKIFGLVKAGDMRALARGLGEYHSHFLAITDEAGLTPLHVAVIQGHDNMVKQLVGAGVYNANVEAVDRTGKTPLYYAKNASIAITLINAGAKFDPIKWITADPEKTKLIKEIFQPKPAQEMLNTTLIGFVAQGNAPLILRLVSEGADSDVLHNGKPLLHHALTRKDIKLVQQFIQKDIVMGAADWVLNRSAELEKMLADLKTAQERETVRKQLHTAALFDCVKRGDVVGIRQVVACKVVNLTAKNEVTGLTAVLVALDNPQDGALKFLLDDKEVAATVAAPADDEERSLLLRAKTNAVRQLLLEKGVKYTGDDLIHGMVTGQTPPLLRFLESFIKENTEARTALQNKVNMATDRRLNTLLHLVIGHIRINEPDVARLVTILLGISTGLIDKKNRDGETPLMVAVNGEQQLVIRALLAGGARLNETNKMNLTALQMVNSKADRGESPYISYAIADMLKKHAADLNKALVTAASAGDLAAIQKYCKQGAEVNALSPIPHALSQHPKLAQNNIGNITPLMAAVLARRYEAVHFLVSVCNANPNISVLPVEGNYIYQSWVRQRQPGFTALDFVNDNPDDFKMLKILLPVGAQMVAGATRMMAKVEQWLSHLVLDGDYELLCAITNNQNLMSTIFTGTNRGTMVTAINQQFHLGAPMTSAMRGHLQQLITELETPEVAHVTHGESSMAATSAAQREVVDKIKRHYGPEFTKRGGTDKILESLRKYLAEQFESNQSSPSDRHYDATDPDPRTRPTYLGQPLPLDCKKVTDEAQKELYYRDVFHTAWRYLATENDPNPLMNGRAVYVLQNYGTRAMWPDITPADRELMAYLWLAASDTKIEPVGTTLRKMRSHFAEELALINRGHNWDRTREKEYDLFFMLVNNRLPALAEMPSAPHNQNCVVLMKVNNQWHACLVIKGQWVAAGTNLVTVPYNEKIRQELEEVHRVQTEKTTKLLNISKYKYPIAQEKSIQASIRNMVIEGKRVCNAATHQTRLGYVAEMEYYDDMHGDNPSCSVGVAQRLHQAVHGNPLCFKPPLTPEIAKEEFWNFVNMKLVQFLGQNKRAAIDNFRAIAFKFAAQEELTDAEKRIFNSFALSPQDVRAFFEDMMKKYGIVFSALNPKTAVTFKRDGNTEYKGYRAYIEKMAGNLWANFYNQMDVVIAAAANNCEEWEKTYRERWARLEPSQEKLNRLNQEFLAANFARQTILNKQLESQLKFIDDANLYASKYGQLENHQGTEGGAKRTARFYEHYNAQPHVRLQLDATINKLLADRDAHNALVKGANAYADSMATAGQDRTTAFYQFYNKETQDQRVEAANRYASRYAGDRTTGFYQYYNAKIEEQRKLDAEQNLEIDAIEKSNKYADRAMVFELYPERHDAFFAYYKLYKVGGTVYTKDLDKQLNEYEEGRKLGPTG